MNREEALEKIFEYIENEEVAYTDNLEDNDDKKDRIRQMKGLIFLDELRDYIKENLK